MKSQKQRVFLVARKRKIPIENVDLLLQCNKAPGSYRVSPAMQHVSIVNEQGQQCWRLMPADLRKREISKELADKIVKELLAK